MPSITLEYTSNVDFDTQEFFQQLHQSIVETGALREGRPRAVREEIAQRAMSLMDATFGHYRDDGHISLSTDMKELEVGLALTKHNIPAKEGEKI